ncbi:response regulator [Microvirga tunisiensis]|uniref:Response regulator n=2 Tax=Pannonibacter tanglangensis TaxID=2750084 RepID=A0A7X5J8H3_9HYPH|nr:MULTISPECIES: response regulator transcription factor [unclassified Pannonibacter]NBN62940.1 response regulator [Pannonibacter sp. XCT-34]NBN78512.1 response regulator [Pannonibacter sp. XCT-53]
MRILIAEDDPRIAGDITAALEASGYVVTLARTGEDAWFLGDTEPFDLIILDLGLPRLDGLTVLRRWRAGGLTVPVLILTARGAWSERVEGIDAGADDYLPKPFHMEELLARARALIRRAAGVASPVISAGPLTLDTRQMRVMRGAVPLNLTPLEYRLTSFLIHHMGRVVPAGELLDHLYGDEDARDANALEALVTRLRRKLGPDVIETRRGFGYVIAGDGS